MLKTLAKTLCCCHALSLGKRVIAVEPIARNVYYLLKNLRDNGWANQAEVYPVALGQKILTF